MKSIIRTPLVVVVAVLLAGGMKGQDQLSQREFDSLSHKAMANRNSNVATSYQCLETLNAAEKSLSDLQRARLGYLQMKVYDADSNSREHLKISAFTAPGSLSPKDSLQYYARRYLERSMPDMAIPLLMKALEILPANSEDADHATVELSEAYRQKAEYRKGIRMIMDLLAKPVTLSDRNRAYAWNRLAALYNETGSPAGSYTDSVFKYSMLCRDLAEKTGNKPDLAAAQNELSFQYTRRQDYNRALDLSHQAVSNFLAAGMHFQAMNVLINQSNIYVKKRDFRAAAGSLARATSLAPVWENRNLYMRIYLQYSTLYTAMDDCREAYGFLQLYLNLQNDFFKDRMNIQIVEQSARYDLFVKEQKIREEQKKNEYTRRQILLLAILTAVITLAFFVTYFYFRLSRKGAIRQKLVSAVLETETNERRRIARDLHDGIGPLLSPSTTISRRSWMQNRKTGRGSRPGCRR
jgi:signal transduction histidine kinase